MTRKDYVLIAEIVRSLPIDSNLRQTIAQCFAFMLGTRNDNFHCGKFLVACHRDIEVVDLDKTSPKQLHDLIKSALGETNEP